MLSFPNWEPVHCSMSGSNSCFLTCIQVSLETGKVIWYAHLFKYFPQFVVIHTVKGFNTLNKAEVGVFLEFSCFSYGPRDVGNLIFGSSAFSKPSLNIWKFSVHILLKPNLENFEHYFTTMWNECNCAVVWRGFPGTSAGKESTSNAGDPGLIPGSGRSTEEGIGYSLQYSWVSLVTQLVKNLPAMQETWVRSLSQEDPLEKGKATHSSILAWRTPWII